MHLRSPPKQVEAAPESGKDYRAIAKQVVLHPSTVRQILYQWKGLKNVREVHKLFALHCKHEQLRGLICCIVSVHIPCTMYCCSALPPVILVD
jgi:hypothetical protein